MLKIKAIGVSEGLARAKALVIRDVDLTVVKNTVTDIEAEQQRALEAVENAKAQIAALRDETEKNIGPEEAEIFDAHLMMLEDPDFVEGMTNEIADESVCAEFACMVNCENFQAMFRAMDDEYMQARAADIGDISMRVLKNLKGIAENPLDTITEPCIVVANDLTPSDTAKMGGKPVVGFITKIGGRTSHSAIMARSMGIPAVVGAGEKLDPIEDGMELLIDGAAGELTAQPDEETLVQFAEKKAKDDERRAMLAEFRDRPGETSDGRRIIIEGNIGTPGDAVRVMELGGEGVGLFRSEFLFMDRPDLPSEEEQFQAYKKAVETMDGRPVIIRTLDIGGDKEVPALDLEKEQNPFLGYRAIRICLNRTDLFLVQLRALLRAARYGDLRIMFPMISSVDELRNAKQVLREASDLLEPERQGRHHGRNPGRGGLRGCARAGGRLFLHRHERPHSIFVRGRPHQREDLVSLPSAPSGRAAADRHDREGGRRERHRVRRVRRDGRHAGHGECAVRSGRDQSVHVGVRDAGGQGRPCGAFVCGVPRAGAEAAENRKCGGCGEYLRGVARRISI